MRNTKQQRKKWRVEFESRIGGKRFAKTFTVVALDQYGAMDAVQARIGAKRYEEMVDRKYRFGAQVKARKLSGAAKKVLSNLTPEEE